MAPITLSEHLANQQGSQGALGRGVATVVGRMGRVAAVIAKELAHAALRDRLGSFGGVNVTGDEVKKLDVWAHDVVESALRATGACAAFVSEEAKEPVEMTAEGANPLVVCCDPVDGSSNLDVNGSVGTIFSLRPSRGEVPAGPAALGPGTDQVAAGYMMYGPATTMVYTSGRGTHGFTLEPETGEFLLTHPDIKIKRRGCPCCRSSVKPLAACRKVATRLSTLAQPGAPFAMMPSSRIASNSISSARLARFNISPREW